MKTSAIQITADGQLESCDADQAIDGAGIGSGTFWMGIDGYDVAKLDALLDRLHLTPFARNRLLKQGEITKVVAFAEGIVLDLRVPSDSSTAAPTQVAFLCLKNLVVEVRPEADPDSRALDARIRELELMDTSATGILLSVLLLEANRVSQAVREIRSDVFALDERMDRDPGGVSLDDILESKDCLLRLLSVTEEQLASFEALTASGGELLNFSNLKGSVQLLLSSAGFSERMAERIEKRIADLRQRFDAHQQEKLNHRLAILTVISAIFLPLTLIAGIWGMNFERMPELGLSMGYPIALTAMVCIAGGMLWFFHRRGWFD